MKESRWPRERYIYLITAYIHPTLQTVSRFEVDAPDLATAERIGRERILAEGFHPTICIRGSYSHTRRIP